MPSHMPSQDTYCWKDLQDPLKHCQHLNIGCHEPLLWRLPLDSSYVVSYCSPTRYCPFPVPLFFVPAPRAYCTSAYCHVHVYSTVPLLPGDLSFDLLSPGKPSCISLCTYFAQYILLSPVLSVELCSSLYCSQSAGAPACLTLGSSSSLDSSRNTWHHSRFQLWVWFLSNLQIQIEVTYRLTYI